MADKEVPDIIGMSPENAEKFLKAGDSGFNRVRVTSQNGVKGLVTADYRENRVNVAIEGGRIVRITGIG